MMPNPAAGDPGEAAVISLPGLVVSLRSERNLKLACFWLRHRRRISRVMMPADTALDNVRSLTELKEFEDDHSEPTEAPVINEVDWPKTFEAVDEHFDLYSGKQRSLWAVSVVNLRRHRKTMALRRNGRPIRKK